VNHCCEWEIKISSEGEDGKGGEELSYVFGPALAMDKRPGLVCFFAKFSSANFSP